MARLSQWGFVNRYCGITRRTIQNRDGVQIEIVDDTGEGPLARTELRERLKYLMLKRNRKELWKDTPPKMRQIIRIEPSEKFSQDLDVKNAVQLFNQLEATLKYKVSTVAENVVQELCEGYKTIVWCLTRNSVSMVVDELEKQMSNKQMAPRLRKENTQVWETHGEASHKARNQFAREFREHVGAGVIVVTMDSMPVAISLKGAETQHYAQLHWTAGTMEQSESRAFAEDVRSLKCIYYELIGSQDSRVLQLLLPRLTAMDLVTNSSDASEIRAALKAPEEVESFEEFRKRFLSSVSDNIDAHSDDLELG